MEELEGEWIMEKIDIILWVLSGGFGLMLVMWHFLNNQIENQDKKLEKLDERFNKFDERLHAVETRVAIIETKLTDVSNNISHLMWHHQALPSKEAEEL